MSSLPPPPADLVPLRGTSGLSPSGATRPSHGQRALWFLERLAPEGGAYHIVVSGRVRGAAEAAPLHRALLALVERHPLLRARFPAEEGEPVLEIGAEAELDFAVIEAASEDEARRHLAAAAYRPFDLERGPLLRARLATGPQGALAFLVVVHHIVADFWSLAIIARELAALYRQEAGGEPAALPPVTGDYRDFVIAEEETVSGAAGEGLWDYWRAALEPPVPVLDLATDHPRPPVQTYRGAARLLELDPAMVHDLRAFGRRRGATLFATLAAAFTALLHRDSGQRDLPLGTLASGRRRAGWSGVVGYFVNPLVLRANLGGDPSFAELLARTRTAAEGALAHQEFPFPLLTERLQPVRDPSRPPLFQALFTLQKGGRREDRTLSEFWLGKPGAAVSVGGFEIEPFDLGERRAQFDLALSAAEGAGDRNGLTLALEVNADLFDGPTAARMLEHLAALLAAVVAEPDRPLAELPLLGAGERHQVLYEWNDTGGIAAPAGSLNRLFAAQAAATPDAVALVAGSERLTYRELDHRAERLARGLRAAGVGPEVPVAVLLRRSPVLVAALLAVHKAGGAYVPLDPAYPEERLAFMLRDSGAPVLLTESAFARRPVAAGTARVMLVDAQEDLGEGEAAMELAPAAGPRNLAYVIYTSGSTGRPKGVGIEHGSAAALVGWARKAFTPAELAGVLAATSISFDLSVFELFAPLASGGRVILARDALELPSLPAASEVTLVNTVPSVMIELLRLLEPAGLPASVRTVCLAGEPLPRALAERLSGLGVARVLDLYGPSEDTTYSTGGPGGAGIGRPLPGRRAHLLGPAFVPLPIGVPGEIHLGGAGLARCYLGRPDLTAERFVPDPFAPEPGGRLYRTGDLARRLADGRIEILGRLDQQVKVRGFRIELGEVETALERHPRVRQAVVAAREGPEGPGEGSRLIAWFLPAGEVPDPAELRRFLAERLPDPMLPSAFVPLEVFPLTPGGKVDRRALPPPPEQRPEGTVAPVPPRTPTEELLAAIWCEVLELPEVGARDSFFDLGGHSLLATRVVARVRRALGVELPVRAIFEEPTLEGLARFLDRERIAGRREPEQPLVPVPRDEPLPLSFAQQRLWLLDRRQPGSPAYNLPGVLAIRGPLPVPVLARAFEEIVRRHESLRTTFAAPAGEPVQIVHPPAGVPLPVVDLVGLASGAGGAEARRLLEAEAARPLDLERGPLLRFLLLRLGEEEHRLAATLHHIAGDGWSLALLARELETGFAAFAAGRPFPLPPLPVQYGDFAVWQRLRLSREALAGELDHWRRQLAGMPPALDLPADRPRPARWSGRGAMREELLPRDLGEALAAVGRRSGATLLMTLLAGFAALLGRFSGEEDFAVGSPHAGRDRVETEGLIGFFVNLLVLRADLSGDPAFGELLLRVREVTLAAQTHRELPFELLVEELAPERDPSRAPLAQVTFALGEELPPLALPGLAATAFALESGAAKFDLALEVTQTAAGLLARLEYATDLFDATTAVRLLAGLARVLAAVAAGPQRRISELDLASEAERHQMLVEWNDTRAGEATEPFLWRRFAAWAARAPEALAVAAPGERATYGDLGARAAGLARELAGLGIGPEVPVGICLDRSVSSVAALLAVHAAGGVALPLDPAHPPERLAFTLRDAGARVVLTSGRLAPLLGETGAEIVVVDGLAPTGGGEALDAAAGPRLEPEDAAYLIYTSGSTGVPKGSVLTHAALANLISWLVSVLRPEPGDRASHLAGPAFDATLLELWPALVSGAAVHVPPAESVWDPARLLDWLADEEITLSFLPTPLLEAVLARGAPLPELALRRVMTGGDRLGRRPPAGLGWRLLNLYGPTENTSVTTWGPVASEGLSAPAIGRPVGGVRVHLLDRALRPVPPGAPGEICAAGAGLSRGYLGRPDLTAERFVPDPFAAAPGGRLYRTGDLARWRPAGEIEFLGRIDQQVKVRGVRIEPGEIEAALERHPAVREAAVVAPEAEPGRSRLAAFLVPHPGLEERPRAEDLAAHLRRLLPPAMIPEAFVWLPALPLTPNGKVDRRALLRLAAAGHGEPRQDEASRTGPRGPAEELVAAAFAEVFGREAVGRDESFFDLGGHSLLAARLLARIRQSTGCDLPLEAVFEAPVVADLAARVEGALGGGAALPPIEQVPREGDLPLSFAQRRLWFLDRLAPGGAAYNVATALRLVGPLRPEALRSALATVVSRHEVLRTVFVEADGEPRQRIHPPQGVPLPVIDLGSLAAPDREREALRLAQDEARRPFDLARGPLLRTGLLRLSEEEHLLVLALHHIVADGWSLGVLAREVSALHAAPAPSLPELPVQYADFAVWQRRVLTEEAVEADLAYWTRQLAGAPAVLALPLDRPRPPVATLRGGRRPVALGRGDWDEALRLARAAGATPFMVLLAAFQALLARWAGQEDVVVGTPVAGRRLPELEGLIGCFVNNLVLRTGLEGVPTFGELVARCRATVLAAHAHQDLPFERLVEALEPERQLAHAPLFQVMLAFLDEPPEASLRLPGVQTQGLQLDRGAAQLDLTLALAAGPAGVEGALEHNRDLFDATTAERLLAQFRTLFAAASAGPETPLSDLPLLSPGERHQILSEWNDTRRTWETGAATLHGLVAAQVARTPEAVAVEGDGEALTYRELAERANRLAHHLRRLGVGPEARVGICLERSPDMVVAFLAALTAGGAYVPLDPGDPRERLARMLEDAGLTVLVSHSRLSGRLPETGCPAVLLDAGRDSIAAESPASLEVAVDPEELAYVIFTSGSTGRPKGAMNSHAGIVNRLLWMQETYRLEANDRVLQKTPVSFDVSVWELFWPLIAGARVVLARPGGQGDPRYLGRLLAERGITTLHFVPSMLRAFLEGAGAAACATVRRVIASGEALSPDLRDRALDFFATADLENLYGPTEAAVDVTRWACRRGAAERGVPIGRPIANTSIHLLDRALRPVPVGVAGELWIGGRGVGRGYLGRPELTAERFAPDPFGEPGARLYRTGDLARRLPGGEVDFLGRADQQVKVRGFRIELGEVEAALLAVPGVREAAVTARDVAPGDVRLVAYVAPGEAAAGLAAALRLLLPEPMVPSLFVPLPALPLTPSGKVDRRALPQPAAGSLGPAREWEPPRGEVEELLATVWSELLEVPRVGRGDGFFDLGGHSLLATRLVSRVAALFGVEVPLPQVFAAPTLAGLAERIAAARTAGTESAPPLVPRSWEGRRRPPSFAQERLWFLERLEPGGAAYNVPLGLRLTGELDVPALDGALAAVVSRHETLRTRFASAGGEVWQEVDLPGLAGLPLADLGALPAPVREGELRRLARDEAARGFDLAGGPLLRAVLLRLDGRQHALLLTFHHAVSDAWSLGVLLRELGTLYGTARRGEPSPLAPLPVQYADFAAWQREVLAGPALEARLGFWRETLRGLPPELELPFDRPRPAVRRMRGARRGWAVPAPVAAELRELGRREGATLFMVLLAAFSALLGRHTGQEDVVVGTAVAQRTRREVEGLVGFFANTLVLRTDLSGDPAFRAFLARVRERALGAYAHQDLPFERLVEELAPERHRARPPLVQAILALQNVPLAFELPGLAPSLLPAEGGAAKLDLTLALVETSEGLSGVLEYDPDLFDASTAARILDRFSVLLGGLASAAGRPLSELPLLPEAERHQLEREWNDTRAAFPQGSSLHGEFAAQAARTPAAMALVWDGGRLTYRELDAAACRLARRLRAAGVGSEARVGLLAERSPEMVVGTLAILQAGGAYVPLDPGYPRERLALLLEDAGIETLLAREDLLERLPPHRATVLPLVSGLFPESEAPASCPEEPGGDRLAYVMYTSGSTGRPKGVAVTHANVLRLVRSTGSAWLGPGEVFLQLAPISFDAATLEIWGPLLNGGCLAIPPPGPLSLAAIGNALARQGVTALWLTAGLFHRFVEENLAGLAPVRQLLAGGDALSPSHAARVLAGLPECRLINGYGPTEGTTFTCCHEVSAEEAAGATLPIGRPIANTRVHLIDARLAPVPLGAAGELAVGGDGLARGYLGDPARTAERFVPDPFSGAPGARLYRTGDRVRRLPDGRIVFLGRLDRQVKIRGFRVEPGEVEAALARHPSLAANAVDVRTDPAGDRRLVAWVVPAPGARVSASDLRAFLAALLPAPLVPAAFVLLPALPLDPNGKVDRRALSDPEGPAGSEGMASADPITNLLCEVFAGVLGRARVGPEESFFELGGHSLLVTRLVARLRGILGAELPLADVFEAASPAALARRVAAAQRSGPDLPLIPPAPRPARLPLSFAQERLWFLDRLEPGRAAYNIAQAVEARGPLDPAALAAALSGVAARHEALRTVFAETTTGPVQVVRPTPSVPLPVADLSGLPAALAEAEARRLEAEAAERPFDLAAGPLLRAGLILRGPGDHRLLLVLHHIVADGWSMGILVREAGALYGAARDGRPSPLPALPVQYADVALWQRRRLAGEAAAADLAWWRDRLAGAPPALDLPTDRPRPAVPSLRGEVATADLPDGLAAAVSALARREGATPFMVLLAAFQALLARWTGQDDLTVGSPIAGRRHAEVEGLIGPFLNLLVLRADQGDDPAFRDALGRVRRTALGAYAHQDLPFERLVEELRPERDLGRSPLFQVLFALQNAPAAPVELPGLSLFSREVATGTAKFDWTLVVGESEGGTTASLEFATDLFDRTTAERVLRHFRTLLKGAVADPGRRLSRLPLLDEAERGQILSEWNDTAAPLPEVCLHELFKAWTDRSPDAVALEHGGERLTYAGLAARVSRLARRLRASGVGPEVRVALLFERSADMVAALLGVLAAGGAYVPLDPGHPVARLRLILEDSGAAVLLAGDGLPPDLVGALTEGLPELEVLSLAAGGREEGSCGFARPLAVPDNLAYVLYTSGSTGRPKGVGVPHRAMVNFLTSMARQPGLGSADRLLAVTTLSFDIAGLELLLPLATGATVVIAGREEASDGALLAAALERSAATVLQATPSTWRMLFDAGWTGRPGLTALCGGEVLPADLADRLTAATARVVNLYGPTETTVWSTLAEVRPGASAPAIGRPIANTRVHVVDRRLEPVPPGASGELWIGGPGVARGYLGRPDLTAERFVPDPFAAEPGARAYRTGDLARFRPDGELEFLGRIDHQVKVRGFRIELAEVEAALAALPGVRAAAAAVREAAPGDRRLVGYLVAEADACEPAVLRRRLSEVLPAFMVPSAFVRLEALPLTPNGKVDRRALPAPGGSPRRGEHVPPRTPVEEAVALLFKEVLDAGPVGATDDFFDLGGHSLLVARLAARLRESFAIDLSLRSLFLAPTVEGIARELLADPVRRSAVEKRARLLLRLARMSEEEAAALLGQKSSVAASGDGA
jgi:amino acid adenylation domain-containing protein